MDKEKKGLIFIVAAWLCLAVAVWGTILGYGTYGILSVASIILAHYSIKNTKKKLFFARLCQVISILLIVYMIIRRLTFN